MKKNNHEYYEFLISRDKDNDLNSAEKEELKKHLCNCVSCSNFNAKINKLSSIVNLEESPVFAVGSKEVKRHKIHFGYKQVFSVAAAVLVFAGVGIFLNNNENRKAINGEEFLAKVDMTNTSIGVTTNINIKTDEENTLAYSVINEEYDNSAPLSIFFDDYGDEAETYTDNYSKPMQTYLTYSLSDTK